MRGPTGASFSNLLDALGIVRERVKHKIIEIITRREAGWARGNAMPSYAVLYKTEADPDGHLWSVGRFLDQNVALDIFNDSTAREKNIGPFTFEETSDLLPYTV